MLAFHLHVCKLVHRVVVRPLPEIMQDSLTVKPVLMDTYLIVNLYTCIKDTLQSLLLAFCV